MAERNISSNIQKSRNIPWKSAPIGVTYYQYEGQSVSDYSLPSSYCNIMVNRYSSNRGIALAIDWRCDQTEPYKSYGYTWVCGLHRSDWGTWRKLELGHEVISFTATTSVAGNASHDFPSNVIVLSAWSSSPDVIVTTFPIGGASTSGAARWWFNCITCNSTHDIVANTQLTFNVIYKYV